MALLEGGELAGVDAFPPEDEAADAQVGDAVLLARDRAQQRGEFLQVGVDHGS